MDKGLQMSRGFQNLGNTCYLNSLTQVLINTPPLHYQVLNADHTCSATCLVCVVRDIMKSARKSTVVPSRLVSSISKINKNFRPHRQQDPHELYLIILGQFPAELKSIFRGKLRSTVTCVKGHASRTQEDFFNLSLEIANSSSVNASLQKFFEPDTNIPGYLCQDCNKRVRIQKAYAIEENPAVLVIQLNRFNHLAQKVNRSVKFESKLALGSDEYELYGMVEHLGGSINSGHYISYVRAPNSAWYKADDSFVSSFRQNDLPSVKPYLLFYIKKSPQN